MNLFWTPDKEKILRALWDKELSARQIGAKIGATRNAVIGKARRLKLAVRVSNVGYAVMKPKAKIAPPPPPPPPPKVIEVEEEIVYKTVRDAVMGLKPEDCRWPNGAPHENKLSFCGAPQLQGFSYCLKHCRSAYDNFEEAQKKKQANKGER